MDNPLLSLTDNLSWNVAFRQTLTAADDPRIPGGFIPIPRKTMLLYSSIALVGVKSRLALPTWRFGGTFQFCLSLGSIDSQSDLTGVTVVDSKYCPLNVFTLIQIPQYQPSPYIGIFQPFKWFREIVVEVYWYDGEISSEFKEYLSRIETKVDAL